MAETPEISWNSYEYHTSVSISERSEKVTLTSTMLNETKALTTAQGIDIPLLIESWGSLPSAGIYTSFSDTCGLLSSI